jgi:DUF1680 family protein
MKELTARQVNISDPLWSPRLHVNATRAIFHQWEQLEATRCIDNFRIAAGDKDGFREGWFFADSDAYKWLDAASRICTIHPQPKLDSLMDSLIALLARAQQPDGYLFTYNQIHFPGQRWVNLQIEHELYCHGHLIEAGVSHYEATGRRDLLDICIKAADLLMRDFLRATNDKTCGHEEIELALVRLYRVTQNENYLELARRFVDRRGRIPLFPLHVWREFRSHNQRKEYVKELRDQYLRSHPEHRDFRLPGDNYTPKPRFSRQRWYLSALSGLYFQQHKPIRKQTVPVGHSVRFGYLETAVAMICRENSDEQLLSALEQAWERMVSRRMYITGGLGAAPYIEGFGGDYELDPEYAYAETCASLASLFWNWEMALLTQNPRYSDLFEWQLYNATNVGMGQNGDTYLYNNPLEVHHGVTRQGWYVVPCCPSNLSRTFADLGRYIYSYDENDIWIHQYISSETTIDQTKVKVESGLPWNGKVKIQIETETEEGVNIHLRTPSWIKDIPVIGYDPRDAEHENIVVRDDRTIELDFDMSIKLRRAHPKVKGHSGKVAITRGPLVYCLESVDNPGIELLSAQLDPTSLHDEFIPELLGGCVIIHGRTVDGKPLKFIPYFLWGNRGESQMRVWVNLK